MINLQTFKNFLLETQENNNAAEILEKALQKHYANIPEDLQNYTQGDMSGDLNEHLWNKKTSAGTISKESPYFHDIKSVDNALRKHKTPQEFHVYAGLKGPFVNFRETGHIYNHPGYMSTSLNHKAAAAFADMQHIDLNGNTEQVKSTKKIHKPTGVPYDYETSTQHTHILKIKVPKYHPGIYIGDRSHYPEEKEFLLPRGLYLKIHPVPHKITVIKKYDNFLQEPPNPYKPNRRNYMIRQKFHHYTWNAEIVPHHDVSEIKGQ